jgi:hypothetical protein
MGAARTTWVAAHLHDWTREHPGHAAEDQAIRVGFGKPGQQLGDGVAVRHRCNSAYWSTDLRGPLLVVQGQ